MMYRVSTLGIALAVAFVACGDTSSEATTTSSGASGGASSSASSGGAGGATHSTTSSSGAGGTNPGFGYRCGDPNLPMATPSFGGPVSLIPQKGTGGTAVGDLDGDGRDEFVVQIQFVILDYDGTDWTSHSVLPNLNSRRDRFAGDIELADMDMDGDLDIVVPDSDNSGAQGGISWFENDGQLDGAWTEHTVTTFGGNGDDDTVTHLSELEVADIDGNGWPDIVVRDISHGVWVSMQNDGSWGPRIFVPVLPREGLRMWDPDGNGRLDILLNGVWLETPADPQNEAFALHPIKGMEDWYAPDDTTASIRDYACKVDVADFNRDGRVDLVITNAEELSASSPSKPHGISVFLQPSDPIGDTWTEITVTTDHFAWHTLMVADFDVDGAADLLTAISAVGQDNAGDRISLWLNDGTGSAFSEQPISTGETVYQGIIGDADGDGDCDFLAPDHFDAGPVRYFENTTAP